MSIIHSKYIICKAFNTDDLDIKVNAKINDGWIPLEDGSKYAVDPDTDKKIYYQVMVKEYTMDCTLVISSVKTFSATSSEELEKKINDYLINNDARCMGSAYIANGKWIQPIMNLVAKETQTKSIAPKA